MRTCKSTDSLENQGEIDGFDLLQAWLGLERRAFKDQLASLGATSRKLQGQPRTQRAVREAVEALDSLYDEVRAEN